MSSQGQPLPQFPAPEDIDIISLSPPCTGFSGLNRQVLHVVELFETTFIFTRILLSFKSAMDLRNTYIVSGLAFVEHLRPKYIISE